MKFSFMFYVSLFLSCLVAGSSEMVDEDDVKFRF